MLKKLLIAGLVSVSLGMVACTSTPSSKESTQQINTALLQSKTWVLTHIGATPFTTSQPAQAPHLQFSTDLRFSGSDGCNRLMGTYAIHEDAISLSQVASTRMLCLDANASTEKVTEALAKVTHYQVYNHTLRLMNKTGNVLLQFENLKQAR